MVARLFRGAVESIGTEILPDLSSDLLRLKRSKNREFSTLDYPIMQEILFPPSP